jgi:acyl-CoA reductase-like NAD-dependent aldehyde dehydrogenase
MAKPSLFMVFHQLLFPLLTSVEPSTAEVLGQVADLSRDDFQKAIKIADAGFRKYSTSTTFAERGNQLRKWFDLIHENVDDCTYPHTEMG